MRGRLWPKLAGVTLCLSLLTAPILIGMELGDHEALAATSCESPYTFEQTWGTAVRLIRVDLGLEITEKDPEHGYLLFKYTSPGSAKRVHTGSMELVKGKDVVRVTVQLNALPSYHEQMIIDKLAKKLVTEYGDPPKRPDPPPPQVPGDGGVEGGETPGN